MSEDLSIREIFKSRYASPRIQWLAGVISVVALVYLTSQELWDTVDSKPYPEIVPLYFIIYAIIFGTILLANNILDISNLSTKHWKVLSTAIFCTLADLFIISSVEFIALNAIGVFPQDYIQGTILLLLGSLPASLGSVVLSSLTAKSLKERSTKLYEEVRAMRKDFDELKTNHKLSVQKIQELQRENDELIKKINDNNKQ